MNIERVMDIYSLGIGCGNFFEVEGSLLVAISSLNSGLLQRMPVNHSLLRSTPEMSPNYFAVSF